MRRNSTRPALFLPDWRVSYGPYHLLEQLELNALDILALCDSEIGAHGGMTDTRSEGISMDICCPIVLDDICVADTDISIL
jgi:hypothetical protein